MDKLQEKSFELFKKMETDGWELLALDTYKTKILRKDIDGWFAIMAKDGLHVYVEIEGISGVEFRDVKMECPKCGKNRYEGSIEGWDFCPDCEVAPVYKKEIHDDYFSLDKSIKSRAFKSFIVQQTLRNIDELYKIRKQLEEQERAYFKVLEEMGKS